MIRILSLLTLTVTLAACTPSAEESRAFSAPGTSESAHVPSIAVTAGGTVLTSAVVEAGDERRLVVTAIDGTTTEVARGAISDHNQAAPRMVVAPDGTVLVLWVREVDVNGRRFPASDLYLARSSDDGRTFGAPVRVNPAPGFPTSHSFADLAVGPDGTLFVSWLDGTAGDRYAREHPTGAPSDHAGHDDPHHAGVDTGASGTGAPGTDLVVARSADGGQTFGAPVVVASGTCQCCRTALDVASDGTVRVAWRHIFPGMERDMALATSRDGGQTFGAPVRVHADGWAIEGCPHTGPAVATGADGSVHVTWYTAAEGRAGLWHAVSGDGGATFGAPTPLAVEAPNGQTRAVRDRTGRVWIAWEDRRRTRTFLAPVSGGDTLSVAGEDPALAGTASGWALVTVADGTLRVIRP